MISRGNYTEKSYFASTALLFHEKKTKQTCRVRVWHNHILHWHAEYHPVLLFQLSCSLLLGEYRKSCTECAACPAGSFTTRLNQESRCSRCSGDCRPSKEAVTHSSCLIVLSVTSGVLQWAESVFIYLWSFSFIYFFVPRISSEGDSELHQQVKCQVCVWGGLHMHWESATGRQLQILQKAAGDDHSRWIFRVSVQIRQDKSYNIQSHVLST